MPMKLLDPEKMFELAEKMRAFYQEAIDKKTVGASGAGMVKITFNNLFECQSVELEDSALENKVMLQDLIKAAINHVSSTIKPNSKDTLSNLFKKTIAPLSD